MHDLRNTPSVNSYLAALVSMGYSVKIWSDYMAGKDIMFVVASPKEVDGEIISSNDADLHVALTNVFDQISKGN